MPFEIEGGKEILENYFFTNSKEELQSLVFIGEEKREEDKEEALLSLAYFESVYPLNDEEAYMIIQRLLDDLFGNYTKEPSFQIYNLEN